MKTIIQLASNVGTPLALAGIVCTLLFYTLRSILSSKFLSRANQTESAQIIKRIVDWFFYLAMVSVVLGTLCWIVGRFSSEPGRPKMVAAAKLHLAEEVVSDLAAADEHIGLIGTLLTVPLFPPQSLADDLAIIHKKMQDRPFRREAYVAAKNIPELVTSAWWKDVDAFYSHLDQDATIEVRSALLPRPVS
jgi:hypothetical protein